MILKAIRDDDGGKPLLVLVVRQMVLVTLVVALSPLANAGTAVTVVSRCQLYLTTGSSLTDIACPVWDSKRGEDSKMKISCDLKSTNTVTLYLRSVEARIVTPLKHSLG